MKNRGLTPYQEQKLANIREVFIDGRPGFEKIDAAYERFLAEPCVQNFLLKEPVANRNEKCGECVLEGDGRGIGIDMSTVSQS